MLTLLSSMFGIFSGMLPGLLRMWERRYEQKHELEMLKVRYEGMAKGIELRETTADGANLVQEGANLRDHDRSLAGNSDIETLRASVRPVITYTFFALFCLVKIYVAAKLWFLNIPVDQYLPLLWGEEETVLLAAVLSFWFGSKNYD